MNTEHENDDEEKPPSYDQLFFTTPMQSTQALWNPCSVQITSIHRTNAHKVFSGIFTGLGGWHIIQTIVSMVLLFPVYSRWGQNYYYLYGVYYGGMLVSLGNAVLTVTIGILIYQAVKLNSIPKLRTTLILEISAAVLTLIGFGLLVTAMVHQEGTTGLQIAALITYQLEFILYAIHSLLIYLELQQTNPQNISSETVTYES